jgi:hypothetical protein
MAVEIFSFHTCLRVAVSQSHYMYKLHKTAEYFNTTSYISNSTVWRRHIVNQRATRSEVQVNQGRPPAIDISDRRDGSDIANFAK